MKKVDTTTCVICEKREYSLSVGKGARMFAGICDDCEKHLDVSKIGKDPQGEFYAKKADESSAVAASVSEGKSRKAS